MSQIDDATGRVERIHLIAGPGLAPEPVAAVTAEVGLGLRGDRHHRRRLGTLTLIEAEALEWLAAEHGLDLSDGRSRRNLVVRGLGLGALVGKVFRVGEVICQGEERCEPCAHLARLVGPAVLRGLLHTGLRATILSPGTIRVGDLVMRV